MSYRVLLPKFEGPLPLLLFLIRKEEMDIFDINIFQITSQYMEHIRLMKELDLEVAGDFVSMAATLLHIKSRMCLPHYNEDGEIVETEDPRKELVQMLLEYQKFQAAGQDLNKRYLLGRDVFPRGESYRIEDQKGEIVIEEENALFAMIASYRKVIRKVRKNVHQVKAKVQSIASRILELRFRLNQDKKHMLSELVAIGAGEYRVRLLITFLSTLELGRLGFVSLFQSDVFADIHIMTKKTVEASGLERVQEFDSQEVAPQALQMLEQISLNVEADSATNAETEISESNTQHPVLNTEVNTELNIEAGAEAQEDLSVHHFSEAFELNEKIDHNLGESLESQAATDDEILEAEKELENDLLAIEKSLETETDLVVVESQIQVHEETDESLVEKSETKPEIQLDSKIEVDTENKSENSVDEKLSSLAASAAAHSDLFD